MKKYASSDRIGLFDIESSCQKENKHPKKDNYFTENIQSVKNKKPLVDRD